MTKGSNCTFLDIHLKKKLKYSVSFNRVASGKDTCSNYSDEFSLRTYLFSVSCKFFKGEGLSYWSYLDNSKHSDINSTVRSILCHGQANW